MLRQFLGNLVRGYLNLSVGMWPNEIPHRQRDALGEARTQTPSQHRGGVGLLWYCPHRKAEVELVIIYRHIHLPLA